MSVLSRGGFIRSLEYVGDRKLPAKSFVHNSYHDRGQYFVLQVRPSDEHCEEEPLTLPLSVKVIRLLGVRSTAVLQPPLVQLNFLLPTEMLNFLSFFYIWHMLASNPVWQPIALSFTMLVLEISDFMCDFRFYFVG